MSCLWAIVGKVTKSPQWGEHTRREDAKSLRREQSSLLSDLFLFKRWGITRQKATTWIIRPLRKEMYRQFRVAAPHWSFSIRWETRSQRWFMFPSPSFVLLVKAKKSHVMISRATIRNATSRWHVCNCVGCIFDPGWSVLWTLRSTVANQRNSISSA